MVMLVQRSSMAICASSWCSPDGGSISSSRWTCSAVSTTVSAAVFSSTRDTRRVGPGVLAMLGENDGPSMISYATVGATYGLGFFLPFVVILFVMAYVCLLLGAEPHRTDTHPNLHQHIVVDLH